MAGVINDKTQQELEAAQVASNAPVETAPAAVTTPAAAKSDAAFATTNASTHNAGLKGLSSNTVSKLNQYSQGYQQSASVQAAQDYLNGVLNSKPVADAQLGALYDKIMNREQFSYDLNGDVLYQQYKDKYQNLGKQAMMHTMGNATALTGGYGSSYATTAGSQAYQQYLQQLNDIVPELYQQAYNRYNQEGTDMLNRYNMAYGQYRDQVGDWENERNFANTDYWNKYNADYTDYQNMLNYWNQMAQQENTNYYNDRNFYYDIAKGLIDKKQVPSEDLMIAAGLTHMDVYQMLQAKKSSGGGGGSKKKSSGGGGGGDSGGLEGFTYSELVQYKNNQNYRESVTGSKTYSSATMEKAISASEKAGTISSSQAEALRNSASKRR